MGTYDDRTDAEREYDLFLIELGDSISPAAREELSHVLAAEYRAAHVPLRVAEVSEREPSWKTRLDAIVEWQDAPWDSPSLGSDYAWMIAEIQRLSVLRDDEYNNLWRTT